MKSRTLLQDANNTLRKKEYAKAVELYNQVLVRSPQLERFVNFNLNYAALKLSHQQVLVKSSVVIDIVVPVYNALEDVKQCLKSIEKCMDGFKVTTYVVNDASNVETTTFLRDFCYGKPNFELIEHEKNMMYTKTINDGLRASKGDYVVTLNSDTIVTNGWLHGLVQCIRSDEKIGIVGALSNAASWQNVPQLLDENNKFAINVIPKEITLDDMAGLVRRVSHNNYPRVPFVNGFCFMISRAVIETIGYMDEEAFPVGYGEENDYCIRALDAGFDLAIADDVYVYHAKSKSFGHETRKQLSDEGTRSLKAKHTEKKFLDLVDRMKNVKEFDEIRKRIQFELEQVISIRHDSYQLRLFDFNVLFILVGAGGGGGSHSVIQEVTEMRRLGVDARVAVNEKSYDNFIINYSDFSNISNAVLKYNDSNIVELGCGFDIVVGTYFTTMKVVKSIIEKCPSILPAYYVQDYEPLFCPEGTSALNEALASYTLVPNSVLFAKTDWIKNTVQTKHQVVVERVKASIDHEIYKPVESNVKEKIVISAMIRPQTPRRGADRTMRILKTVKKQYGNSLEIKIFGCPENSLKLHSIEHDFEYENYGELKRHQVASVLSNSDIFIDLSDYQAFGRTALEAMATGCISIVPKEGGADEYAIDGINSFVVDTLNYENVLDKLTYILNNIGLLSSMKRDALNTAARYTVHAAAISELTLFSKHLTKYRKLNQNALIVNNEKLPIEIDDFDKIKNDMLITIGIPTYNRPKELNKLLESIVSDNEILNSCIVLIADDGCYSDTASVVKQYQLKYGENKIRYTKNKVNLGYARNFLNLFYKCDTEYLMIVADDNLIFKDGFNKAKIFIQNNQPNFISSPWFEGGKVGHRAWKGHKVGKISLSDFFNSSDHAPGLIYKCLVAKKYLNEINEQLSSGCHFTSVFPQVNLVLNILSNDELGYYVDFAIGTETSVLPSGIKDPSGNQWRTYSSMLLQAYDLQYIVRNITGEGNMKLASDAAQKYYIKYLLKVIDPDVRKSL